MGQMGAGLGKVFNGNSDMVPGTGQSVGDLKGIGYSPDQIQGLGGGQPGAGVSFARNALRGGLNGLQNGVQNTNIRRQTGGGGMGGGGVAPPNQTPTIQPQIYQPGGPIPSVQGGMPPRRMNTLNFYGEQ